jgi:hypothetical protein
MARRLGQPGGQDAQLRRRGLAVTEEIGGVPEEVVSAMSSWRLRRHPPCATHGWLPCNTSSTAVSGVHREVAGHGPDVKDAVSTRADRKPMTMV